MCQLFGGGVKPGWVALQQLVEDRVEIYFLLTDVVLAETAYVLTSSYRGPREVVVDHLTLLLQKENVHPFSLATDIALQALLLCRPSGHVSYADTLVWSAAQSMEEKVVYSFDEQFPTDGVEVRRGR